MAEIVMTFCDSCNPQRWHFTGALGFVERTLEEWLRGDGAWLTGENLSICPDCITTRPPKAVQLMNKWLADEKERDWTERKREYWRRKKRESRRRLEAI